MGLLQSPRVVTDGLVFYYDQNNIKSYQGPAIQNLASTIVPNGAASTGISIVGGYETVNVPQIGMANVAFNNIQNNFTSFSPNSADCCPAPFAYTGGFGSGGFAVSPSTLYTYSIVYKVNSGYTHPNYMYRYEYTSNGGTYVTEGGVHSDSNRIALGDGWFWAWGTFTTQSTTNWIAWAAAFYYRYSNTTDKLSIARVLITPGNYTGLHPIYWPAVNTTRASTQVLSDLSRNTAVIANNVTYGSSGTISFNGSSSFINTGYDMSWNNTNSATVSLILRPDSLSTSRPFIGKTDYEWQMNQVNQTLEFVYWNTAGGHTNGPIIGVNNFFTSTSEFVHLTLVWNAVDNNIYIYRNGSLVNTSAWTNASINRNIADTVNVGGNIYAWGMGGSYWPGRVDVVSMYSRALTGAEVQQNFNALRGRFSI